MKERDVKVSDYEKEQHQLKIALNMSGLAVDYVTTDLIYRTLKKFKSKKGKMTISDTETIKHEHHIFWETYFKLKEEETQNNQ